MKGIVTLSLQGRAFQLEEDGYRRLRAYLDRYEASLRDARQVAALDDVEHVLTGRLAACVDASKTVVTAHEVDAILRELPAAADSGGPLPVAPAPRRLYRVRQGQMLAGLCNGLAVYSQIDVAWVRSLCVVLGLFSGGLLVLIYLVAMFIVPVVDTAEQAAAGRAPAAGR